MVFAESVNLARRLSARNENDLLQERVTGALIWSIYNNAPLVGFRLPNVFIQSFKLPALSRHMRCFYVLLLYELKHLLLLLIDSQHSHRECKLIAAKVAGIQHLPSECHQFNDVINAVPKSSDSNDLSIAFQGMGNSAAAAIKARKTGKQNYAQIQRRFTNTRRFSNGK